MNKQFSDKLTSNGLTAYRGEEIEPHLRKDVCVIVVADYESLSIDEATRLGTFLLAAANRARKGGTCTHCAGQGNVTQVDSQGSHSVDCEWCRGQGGP